MEAIVRLEAEVHVIYVTDADLDKQIEGVVEDMLHYVGADSVHILEVNDVE